MIFRIVEYVAADRALARASLADLAEGRYTPDSRSPEYAAAYKRSRDAEGNLTPREYAVAERVTERVNKRLWVEIWDYEDELGQREVWRADL